LPKISPVHPTSSNSDNGYLPYKRNDRLQRPWAIPGTPGLEHRLGGIEKQDVTGNVSYDAENHQHMTNVRRQKVANIADAIPLQTVEGPDEGDLLVVSWGGTFGAVRTATQRSRREGKSVAHCHIRYLQPFPKNLGQILSRYKNVLVAELNVGQLRFILRSIYLVDAFGLNKVKGKPFLVSELCQKIDAVLAGRSTEEPLRPVAATTRRAEETISAG
jgi:2-oxoglutarate ferredoxin oxidoreductase subunit alpha